MSKLTSVKIKYDNTEELSDQIPIGVQSEEVQLGNGKTLKSFLT